MAPPSRTPERDPLNPMAYEQKKLVPSLISLRSLCVVVHFQFVVELHDQPRTLSWRQLHFDCADTIEVDTLLCA